MVAPVRLVWFILRRTTFGFEVRTVGTNPNAARYAGIGREPHDHRGHGPVRRLRRAGRRRRGLGHGRASSARACSWASASTPSPSRCWPGPTRSPSSSPPFLWGSMLSGAGLMQQETRPVDRRRAHHPGPRAAVRRRRRDRPHDLPRSRPIATATPWTRPSSAPAGGRRRDAAQPPPDDRRALRARSAWSSSATSPAPSRRADKSLTFEPPQLDDPNPLELVLDPPTVVAGDRRRSSSSPRSRPSSNAARSGWPAARCSWPPILLIPLVIVLVARAVRHRRAPTSSSCWSSRCASAPRSPWARWPGCGASAPASSTSASRG